MYNIFFVIFLRGRPKKRPLFALYNKYPLAMKLAGFGNNRLYYSGDFINRDCDVTLHFTICPTPSNWENYSIDVTPLALNEYTVLDFFVDTVADENNEVVALELNSTYWMQLYQGGQLIYKELIKVK